MHGHGLYNEACRDRNQPNKAYANAVKVVSYTERVVLMAVCE